MSDTRPQGQHAEPWQLREDKRERLFIIFNANGGRVISELMDRDNTVRKQQKKTLMHLVACVNGYAGINPEAVKELLELLERCVGYIERAGAQPQCLDDARAAIAKAEGEEITVS